MNRSIRVTIPQLIFYTIGVAMGGTGWTGMLSHWTRHGVDFTFGGHVGSLVFGLVLIAVALLLPLGMRLFRGQGKS